MVYLLYKLFLIMVKIVVNKKCQEASDYRGL